MPIFDNMTFPLRRDIEYELTSALRREIQARTRLRLVDDRVAEVGPASDVLQSGLHPYTHVLSAAIPVDDPDFGRPRVRTSIDTAAPSRDGCLFAPRCPHRMEHCTTVIPVPRTARPPARPPVCPLPTEPR